MGQDPLDGGRTDHESHFAVIGIGPPECAGQRTYSRRVAKRGRAQIGDQYDRALIEDGE
jgi:hypothetical protein